MAASTWIQTKEGSRSQEKSSGRFDVASQHPRNAERPPSPAVAPGTAAVLPVLWSTRAPYKTRRADVRNEYGVTVEVGFILALLALIVLFQAHIQRTAPIDLTTVVQEVVQMEDIVQTEQIQRPPPPPRPQLPVVVSDDVILEDDDIDFDAALDIGEPLEALPPPPAPQEEPVDEVEDAYDEIFVVVEEMPELIGGVASIQREITYPEIAQQAELEGRVFVQFVVDELGNVVDPVVIKGIGGGCDKEALRVIQLARFKPGKQRGKPVKVRYVIPVTFRLE